MFGNAWFPNYRRLKHMLIKIPLSPASGTYTAFLRALEKLFKMLTPFRNADLTLTSRRLTNTPSNSWSVYYSLSHLIQVITLCAQHLPEINTQVILMVIQVEIQG